MIWEGLAGKTALVTGASSGLGEHFAKLLAAQGAHVFLAARREDRLSEVRADILSTGGWAEMLIMDVTARGSVAKAFSRHDAVFDIVVNNAGVSAPGPAIELNEEDWDRVIDTNLKGVFNVAQAAAQRLRDQGRPGSIVNVASILGLRVAGHVPAYAASKAAVIQLTKALALEWARFNIRVNALCPGYIETAMNRDFFSTEAGHALIKRIPQRRLGKLSDLDAPLLLLCSDAASYMTGAVIAVDGGHLVSSL